jgi:hypothetical protein
MNDAARPKEHSPHLDRYSDMSFAQLRRFIQDTLDRLSDPEPLNDEELPRSQEELLALCAVLKAKADVVKRDAPMPVRPTYHGPADPGWTFTSSDKLDALYRQQRHANRRIDDAIRDGNSDTFLEYIMRELEEVERKIAPVERREQQEHEKRIEEYEEARKPYRQRVRLWRAEVARVEKQREAEAKRDAIVQRMYRKVKSTFDPKRVSGPKHITTVPWEIAAPGERTDKHAIYRYYREVLSRGRLDGFDQQRLDKILALPFSGWQRGRAGVYGYIILEFDHTDKVLMECPVRDNAIYVLDSGEERLLKMNKQEIIASDETKIIFHTGDWYERVKEALDIQ